MVVCPKASVCPESNCPHKAKHAKTIGCDNFVCSRVMPSNAACIEVVEEPPVQ